MLEAVCRILTLNLREPGARTRRMDGNRAGKTATLSIPEILISGSQLESV